MVSYILGGIGSLGYNFSYSSLVNLPFLFKSLNTLHISRDFFNVGSILIMSVSPICPLILIMASPFLIRTSPAPLS